MPPDSPHIASLAESNPATAAITSPAFQPVKFVLDRVLCAVLLLVLSPLLLTLALIITLESPGPIFFKQRRGGLYQRPFHIYKFRTMLREAALDRNVPQAKPKDPRLTRIGAFLRRYSLDEMPQLYNVVRGDMSVVGPRPHALSHDTLFAARCTGYERRFRVKPGMTGWAQVNGYRGLVTTDEDIQHRTDCDNYYIDRWSLGLECAVLVKTLAALVRGINAH